MAHSHGKGRRAFSTARSSATSIPVVDVVQCLAGNRTQQGRALAWKIIVDRRLAPSAAGGCWQRRRQRRCQVWRHRQGCPSRRPGGKVASQCRRVVP